MNMPMPALHSAWSDLTMNMPMPALHSAWSDLTMGMLAVFHLFAACSGLPVQILLNCWFCSHRMDSGFCSGAYALCMGIVKARPHMFTTR